MAGPSGFAGQWYSARRPAATIFRPARYNPTTGPPAAPSRRC
jgi:hypothetical protein